MLTATTVTAQVAEGPSRTFGAADLTVGFYDANDRLIASVRADQTVPGYVVDSGALSGVQRLSTLPSGFTGEPWAAEIRFTPDARFLYTSERNLTSNLPYAGFSRVSNPQGNGFTVEAFAASEFTSADGVINGLRRSAATPSAPAFQTNCFLANLNQLEPDGPALPAAAASGRGGCPAEHRRA